jgi:hypothetical protein
MVVSINGQMDGLEQSDKELLLMILPLILLLVEMLKERVILVLLLLNNIIWETILLEQIRLLIMQYLVIKL